MSSLRRRWTIAAVLGLLVALVATAPASAARRANAQQRTALAAAIKSSPVADIDRVPTRKYRVTGATVSTVSSSWALANITPTRAARGTLQGGVAVAVRLAGTRQWVVVDFGSSEVGCSIAPDAVLADLYGVRSVRGMCAAD
jgi:hypothetical protein